MAESNWAFVSNGLADGDCSRGVSTGPARPPGGGNFVFGFSSRTNTAGAVALVDNQSNFAPLRNDSANPTGGSIRGAIKRGVSSGPTNFAPFFLIGLQNATLYGSVTDQCYMLGLSDNDPHEIILRKGAPSGGLLPDGAGVLRVSTAQFVPDTWLHVRLDMIVNPNGDTILKVFQNDLGSNLVTAPVWEPIAGMDDFIDDALGVNSESLPFAGGFVGFGFETHDVGRRGYFDHIQVLRQK